MLDLVKSVKIANDVLLIICKINVLRAFFIRYCKK